MYAHEDVIIPIILNSRISTPEAIKFKSGWGTKQHDMILSKEKSVMSK